MRKTLILAFISMSLTAALIFANRRTSRADAQTHIYDVDLTRMSSTIVYAKMVEMASHPKKYEGKIVRAHGVFEVYEDDSFEDGRIFACLVQDAAACCAQGLEFTLSESRPYPDGYPARWSEITVSGAFHQYEDSGASYITLVDATLE